MIRLVRVGRALAAGLVAFAAFAHVVAFVDDPLAVDALIEEALTDEASTDEAERAQLATDAANWVRRHIEVLEARDADAVRTQFVDDERFVWYTDGAVRYRGPDDVLDGMAAFAQLEFSTELSDVHATVLSRTHVSVRSLFATHLAIPGAPDVRYGGAITWLLERTDDASPWRILLGHTSTPGGPPASARQDDRRRPGAGDSQGER